jgi:PKD repeat protein
MSIKSFSQYSVYVYGTVLDQSAIPQAGILVSVYSYNDPNFYMDTLTDAVGNYSFNINYPTNADDSILIELTDICDQDHEFTQLITTQTSEVFAPFTVCGNPMCSPDFYFDQTDPMNYLSTVFKQIPSSVHDSVIWDFGDGSLQDTVRGPSFYPVPHDFPSYGDYNVTLTVYGDPNCTGTNSSVQDVDIEDPYAEYTTSYTYFDYDTEDLLTYNFYDETWVEYSNYVTSWQWDFGDGQQSAVKNPVHTYTTPGEYQVTLTTTTMLGGSTDNVWQDWVWVGSDAWYPPSCQALFYTNYTVNQDSVEFHDFSWAGFGAATIIDYQWNFGDGKHSIVQNPIHKFTNAGQYNVSLTITTNVGETSSYSSIIYLNGSTTNGILFYPAVSPVKSATCRCTNMSGTGGWVWNYGDNTKEVQKSGKSFVDHVYANPGVYMITLKNSATGEAYATRINFTESKTTPKIDILQSYAFNGNIGTGIKKLPNGLESLISLYPNPAVKELNINFAQAQNHVSVSIVNIAGQTVISKYFNSVENIQLNTSNLAQGIYFAKISANGQTANLKFVK